MNLSNTKLFRELIKATLEFNKQEPWDGCLDGNIFAFRLQNETYPWFASVVGGDGDRFGLSLSRGPNSATHQAVMLSKGPDELDESEYMDLDFLLLTINPLHEVPAEMRKHLEKARFPARRETPVPYFGVKEPGNHLRNINSAEACLVLCIVNAILKTLAQGLFKPGLFLPGKDVLTLTVGTDNPLDPAVEVSREVYEIPAFGSGLSEPEDPEAMPDPDDLDAWKSVDLRVTGRLVKATKTLVNDKTMAEFFGSLHDAEDLLSEYGDSGAQACYVDWLAFFYCRSRQTRSVVQELLETGLPKADQILLKSRAAAVPTLCRIVSVDDGFTVKLEDVFTGEVTEAHDRMMAEGLRRNNLHDMILPVRHYAAGSFTFLAMIGPNFSDQHLSHLFEFLEEIGLHPTDRGFEQNLNLLGRLWLFIDNLPHALIPDLNNTDNEPFESHTASYRVTDAGAFRKALLARADVDPEGGDEGEDTYIWFREETNPKPGMGDRTLLGRIQLVGGEAVTEVNSAARHEHLKAWLCQIPGVAYVDVRRKSILEMMDDRPLDDELNPPEPVEMNPELVAAMNQHIERYYMDWLDQPIPALDNKTPRQCCNTKSGQTKVTALIRGMSTPTLGGRARGVDVPRAAMLRELGLQ